jgi:hypothetical protein
MTRIVAAALGTVLAAVSAHGATGYASPDGAWSVTYTRNGLYGNIDLAQRATGRRIRMYRSNDSCCTSVTWIAPHLLVFDDDYHVKTLDPPSRRVRTIAHFSNFVVAPDGRWVAGWAAGPGQAERVGVVPARGGACRVVPHLRDEDDNAVASRATARGSRSCAAASIRRAAWWGARASSAFRSQPSCVQPAAEGA